MIVSDTAVNKRTTVFLLALLITIVGAYSYIVLPREAAPDVTIPTIFVSTSYRGVSPADIEKNITSQIEKQLKGLKNLKKITSTSSLGLSQIMVEFVTGTDIDDARQRVKDKVDMAKRELPNDLEDDPTVFEINVSELPVLVLAMSGECDPRELRQRAKDLADLIEAVPGVLEAEVAGGLEREIHILPSVEKLALYGIPFTSLQSVVAGENQNTSGGSLRLRQGRYQLRVPGEFKDPNDIYGLVVAVRNGTPVFLRDIARIEDGHKDPASDSRFNGKNAVTIFVKKRVGENIIRIIDAVFETVDRESLRWPPGIEVTPLMNRADEIRMMVADLENNIATGMFLVVVVICCAMGLRNAALVSLAIPLSMLLSFTVLQMLGITLNMVVLFSLTLALGMLVDNAIVIVENIYRYMQQGVPRIEAAKRATSEVAYPVIASTITTVAAFFPLLFWPGIMGDFMHYLPLTVIVTLLASLFVAMVVNPALASVVMRLRDPAAGPAQKTPEEIEAAGEQPAHGGGRILRAYRRLLGWALDCRVAVVLMALLILAITIQAWLLRTGLERPVEFFATIDPKRVYVNMDMPEGYNLQYANRITREIEKRVCDKQAVPAAGELTSREVSYDEAVKGKTHALHDGAQSHVGPSDLANIESIYAKVSASAGESGFMFGQSAPNNIGIEMLDMEDRVERSPLTMRQIRERIGGIPGAKVTLDKDQHGPPTGAPINIEIVGHDYAVLSAILDELRPIVARTPHVYDIRDDLYRGSPTLRVDVNRQRAALLGLSTNIVGFALKAAINGLVISTYREANEDYDITVQLPEDERNDMSTFRRLFIPAPTTPPHLVPLSAVSKVSYTGGLGRITRINRERVVTLQANVDETRVPGAVARQMAEERLRDIPLPPGYQIRFTGEFEFQQEAQDFLRKAFLIAVLLVMIVLVAQFNSITVPFVIITSVVLSFIGVFMGLALYDMPFGIIMTGVGVISLAGVVVNNAIVLIAYTEQLRQRGLELREAIIAAGATRLRPVLLTAITTILGLIPMVTGISFDVHTGTWATASESSQWWRTMAVAVIFGLGAATVLTLVFVPVLYSLAESASEFGQKAWDAVVRAYKWPQYKLLGIVPEQEEIEP